MKLTRILFSTSLALLILSCQTQAANILFVGGQPDAAQGDDSFVLEHLEDTLGHNVTYLTGDESSTGDAQGQDLLIISSTLGSGSVRHKFQDEEIPIMQWEEALIRWDHGEPDGNFRMAQSSRNGQNRETTIINIVEEAVGHPLAAGLPAGEHEIFEFENRTPQSFGELPPGLIRIAELDPAWAEEEVSFWIDENGDEVFGPEFVLTAVDKGGELGPPGDGFFAPEKRVNFPIEDIGFSILNETGLKLFDAAVDWLLGGGVAIGGDYNGDGVVDTADIDLQSVAMSDANPDLAVFDENGDGQVNFDDRQIWIRDHANTWVGDSNLDNEFNSGDLVAVFTAGKFELDEMASWAEGDWDGDMRFGSGDLVAAFTDGGYELGPPPAANAVPEPSSLAILLVSGLLLARRRRR